MLTLIVERLRFNLREVGGLVVFQLNHTYHVAVKKNGTIGLLGVRFVLLLSNQIEAGRRIQRVAQHIHEQFPKETLLKLLFVALQDVQLDLFVQKITLVLQPGS